MSINDNMNNDAMEYGVTDIANIVPFSPTDRTGPSGSDVSKEVFGLTSSLGQLFGADWDGELDNESASTAVHVMQELGRCLDYVGSVSAVLIQALSSKELDVRINAANILAKLKGLDVGSLLPVLTQAVFSDDVTFRRIAAETIGHIGPAVSSLLAGVLIDRDQMVRHFGLMAIQRLGPDAAFSTNALAEILVTENAVDSDEIPQINQRMDACDALRAIGPGASKAIPHLLSVIAKTDSNHDDELWLRLRAARAHFAISGEIEPCRGTAISLLDYISTDSFSEETTFDSTFWLREFACDVLAEIGPRAVAAIPRLRRCLVEDPNDLVHRAAQKALNSILEPGCGT